MDAGWIAVLVLALLLLAFLLFPIRIFLCYDSGNGGSGQAQTFRCVLELLWWKVPLYPSQEKMLMPQQRKRKGKKLARKNAKRDAKAARKGHKRTGKTSEKPHAKRNLSETLDLLLQISRSGSKAVKRFWKGFRVDHLTLYLKVGGADAQATAVSYGKANAAVYTVYAFLMQLVTLRCTKIQIEPDFITGESRIYLSGKLFFRIGTVLAAGLAASGDLLRLLLGGEKAQKTAVS